MGLEPDEIGSRWPIRKYSDSVLEIYERQKAKELFISNVGFMKQYYNLDRPTPRHKNDISQAKR